MYLSKISILTGFEEHVEYLKYDRTKNSIQLDFFDAVSNCYSTRVSILKICFYMIGQMPNRTSNLFILLGWCNVRTVPFLILNILNWFKEFQHIFQFAQKYFFRNNNPHKFLKRITQHIKNTLNTPWIIGLKVSRPYRDLYAIFPIVCNGIMSSLVNYFSRRGIAGDNLGSVRLI